MKCQFIKSFTTIWVPNHYNWIMFDNGATVHNFKHISQVVERLRSCEAACELLEKYNMSYQTETNWMDELDSKLRNLEELEEARAKEAWEKHVVSTNSVQFEVIRVLSAKFMRCSSLTALQSHKLQANC